MKFALGTAYALILIAFVLGPQPVAAATTASIEVVDFAFVPSLVTIDFSQTGNALTFHYDAAGFTHHQPHGDPHNTALQAACFAGPVMAPNDAVTVSITWTAQCLATIASDGSATTLGPVIEYHCHIHPGMVGKVQVKL